MILGVINWCLCLVLTQVIMIKQWMIGAKNLVLVLVGIFNAYCC